MAKALDGKRIPVTGIDRDGADVTSDLFAVQVKHGRRRPSYLADWLSGIRAQALAPQVGVVVWCDNRECLEDAVVLMSMKDFVDLHGKVKP